MVTAKISCFCFSDFDIAIFLVGGKHCIMKHEKRIVFPKSLYFNSYHANCKHKLSSTTKVTKYMHSAKMKRIIRHCDYTLIKL